jgi:hypothetical protein
MVIMVVVVAAFPAQLIVVLALPLDFADPVLTGSADRIRELDELEHILLLQSISNRSIMNADAGVELT